MSIVDGYMGDYASPEISTFAVVRDAASRQ